MKDPGAQQPSQMFFFYLGEGPTTTPGTPCPTLCEIRPIVICNKGYETGPPAYSPYPIIINKP